MNIRRIQFLPVLAALLLSGCDGDRPDVLLGTLEYDRITLTSPFSEPVARMSVEEGQEVTAGTLVLALDDARLAAQHNRLEAERQQASARLAEVLRGPREELVAADRARLDGALAELEDARSDLARQRELRTRGLVSQAQVDQAQARFGRAQAARDEAARMLEAAVEGSTKEEIEQARQRLAAAEAAVAANRVDLRRLEIRSPVDGLLDSLPFEQGEIPPAGATLAVVLDTRRPYARVYLPETWRGRIGPGDKLPVRLHEMQVTGTVRRVSSDPVYTPFYSLTETDRTRLAYLTEIDLPADTSPEWAGAPVEVELPAGP